MQNQSKAAWLLFFLLGATILLFAPTHISAVLDVAQTWTATQTFSSIFATGTVDGLAPLTITTGASCNLGVASGCNSTAYDSGYTLNQEGTAATAITYTLPTPIAGLQYCVKNSNNGSAADTGTLEVIVNVTGTQSVIYNGTKSSSGFIQSSGLAGDAACFIAISNTQWEAYAQVGTWTLH